MNIKPVVVILLLMNNISYAAGNLAADKEGTKIQGFSPSPQYSKCVALDNKNDEFVVDTAGKAAIRYVGLDISGEVTTVKRYLNDNKAYMAFGNDTIVLNKNIKSMTFKKNTNNSSPTTVCIELM